MNKLVKEMRKVTDRVTRKKGEKNHMHEHDNGLRKLIAKLLTFLSAIDRLANVVQAQ